MGKPKAKQTVDNSVTFQDIAQLINKNAQVINNLAYKYKGRLAGIGKPSNSAYAKLAKSLYEGFKAKEIDASRFVFSDEVFSILRGKKE